MRLFIIFMHRKVNIFGKLIVLTFLLDFVRARFSPQEETLIVVSGKPEAAKPA